MEQASEEQLNRLMRAYDDELCGGDADEEMRQSVAQLDEFEQRLRQRQGGETRSPARKTGDATSFTDVRIPALPEHVRRRVAEQRLAHIDAQAAEEQQRAQEQLVQPPQPASTTEEHRVQYLSGSDAVDRKLRELVGKNKALSLQLGREQGRAATLAEQLERSTRTAEELRRVAAGGEHGALQAQLATALERTRRADEKAASLALRVTSLEAELARAHKALRRELGDKADVEEALREDGGWVGRAQTIEVLRAKLARAQAKSARDPQAEERPRGKALTSNGDKTEEIARLRREAADAAEERATLAAKLKALTARAGTLEETARRARADADEQRALLLEKSRGDDEYIAALKRELAKARAGAGKENARLSSAQSLADSLQPLKPDYVKRITALEKEAERWRAECRRLEQSALVGLGKHDNAIDLSRENYKLRLRVQELESRVFDATR